jgi:hypothetical protein
MKYNFMGGQTVRATQKDRSYDESWIVEMWRAAAEKAKQRSEKQRCGLCDRYFVLADKRKRDYCDRIYDGKRTCKQLGAKKKFHENVEADIYLQEFQRIYNRMYSRYYRMDAWDSDGQTNKLTEKEFKAWTDMASKAKQEYKSGTIDGENLIKRISEIQGVDLTNRH